MKKIQDQVKKNRAPLILTAVFTASVVFLPGCDLFAYKRPFPDAYYTSNFIEGIGFDVFEGDNTAIPAAASDPVTGTWDFAYRYLDWNSFGFISMTDTLLSASSIDVSVPSGLATTAPVFRLVVLNLISDGDFENVSTDGVWTPTADASSTHSTFSPLFGNGNMVLSAGLNSKITYTPAPVIGTPFSVNFTYKTFFRYASSDSFIAKADTTDVSFNNFSKTAIVSFAGTGMMPVFTFQPQLLSSLASLKLDNFRLTRSGLMTLRLLLSPSATNPALESGVYSFSVWVHTDTSAYIDRSPFQLDTFTMTMRAVPPASLSAASDVYSASSGWKKMTTTLAPGALMFTAVNTPVLELIIDFNNTQPGSVLIAQPELRFFPDGL